MPTGRKNPLHITLDHFRLATLWSKNSSNHRVAGRKWSRVTCKGFFHPALIQYKKNFDLQSFLMMVVLLLLLKWLIGKNEVLFVVHEFQNFDSLQTCIKSAESADRKNRSSPKLENHFDYIFPLFFLLIH